MEFLTDEGKRTYELMQSYGLGAYYDPYSGHVIIDKNEINNQLLNRISIFLVDNTAWVMGVEYSDADEKEDAVFYVSPKEDL